MSRRPAVAYTAAEDRILVECRAAGMDWFGIAQQLGGRTQASVIQRWRYLNAGQAAFPKPQSQVERHAVDAETARQGSQALLISIVAMCLRHRITLPGKTAMQTYDIAAGLGLMGRGA